MPSIELKYTFENEEELRAHLAAETRAAEAPSGNAPATEQTKPAEQAEPAEQEQRNDSDVDSDGMPYNPAVHTETRAVNADGTWKARRGKAEEAKAARAAFKAGGGGEEAPADLPGTETKADVPGLPGTEALPADAPAPISWDDLVEKITTKSKSGEISQDQLMALYTKHGGDDPVGVLSVNETARAAMLADLEA